MLLYSQRDPRWANHVLGWGPALGTIGQYGCLDTVSAMIAYDAGHPYNPATIDELFTARQIFVREPTGTYDLLPDNALALAFPSRFSITAYNGFRGDLIDAAIPTPDTYAYVFISTAAVPTHFVLMYSKGPSYQIADPWTGRVGTLAGYGGPGAVRKTILVRKLPVPVVVPAPPPVVVVPPPPPIPVPPPVITPTPVPPPPPVVAPPAPAPLPTPPTKPAPFDFWAWVQRLIIQLAGRG
jgi:hypothetical protein